MAEKDEQQRFHIAEWYGRPFLDLTDDERRELAAFRPKGKMLNKTEMIRLEELRKKERLGPLKSTEQKRLDTLDGRLQDIRRTHQPCPFRTDVPFPFCNKPGGVCSMRLYREKGRTIEPVLGKRHHIRAMCPYRFHEGDVVFRSIGREMLGDPVPFQGGEVGFLQSTGNLDSDPGEDVGKIDMILAKTNAPLGFPLEWCAVEVQAVYFSGDEMGVEFKALREAGGAAKMPVGRRRPDYRSSGPKRLMPQLQTKVPTLRRWGKKMIVVVDVAFFKSMGEMEPVNDISNCDIVWYLVDFVRDDEGQPFHLEVTKRVFTTLERAIEGLTGGEPVTLDAFEDRIREKIDAASSP